MPIKNSKNIFHIFIHLIYFFVYNSVIFVIKNVRLLFNKIIPKSYEYKKLPYFILIIDNFSSISASDYGEIKMYMNKKSQKSKIIIYDNKITTKKEGYPDLIIFLDFVQRFHLKDPMLLYKAEIYHSRYKFSKKTITNALKHYSSCEIRNGK